MKRRTKAWWKRYNHARKEYGPRVAERMATKFIWAYGTDSAGAQ
jgi:hypothetical protein